MKTHGERIWKYLIYPNAQRKRLPNFQLISVLMKHIVVAYGNVDNLEQTCIYFSQD